MKCAAKSRRLYQIRFFVVSWCDDAVSIRNVVAPELPGDTDGLVEFQTACNRALVRCRLKFDFSSRAPWVFAEADTPRGRSAFLAGCRCVAGARRKPS